MVTEVQLLYLYLCQQEQQCIAVGPRNMHFVSIHQVSSTRCSAAYAGSVICPSAVAATGAALGNLQIRNYY